MHTEPMAHVANSNQYQPKLKWRAVDSNIYKPAFLPLAASLKNTEGAQCANKAQWKWKLIRHSLESANLAVS